jgi:hypothetical protein
VVRSLAPEHWSCWRYGTHREFGARRRPRCRICSPTPSPKTALADTSPGAFRATFAAPTRKAGWSGEVLHFRCKYFPTSGGRVSRSSHQPTGGREEAEAAVHFDFLIESVTSEKRSPSPWLVDGAIHPRTIWIRGQQCLQLPTPHISTAPANLQETSGLLCGG